MKAFHITITFLLVSVIGVCQTPESIQLQIDDLEEAKISLENQIKEIDNRLNELYQQKHEATIAQNASGHFAVTKSSAKLYNMPVANELRKVVAEIPKGTRLLITKWERACLRTNFGGKTGYLFPHQLEFDNPEAYKALKEESQRLVREGKAEKADWEYLLDDQQAAAEKKRKERLSKLTSKYGKIAALKIVEGKVWIGMTKEMMIESWGQPEDINRSVGSWGVHEQCIYGDTYVYVENGKVASWQD